MDEILAKYHSLDENAKKEVLNFMDFLLSKKGGTNKKSYLEYKDKILSVSVWSDDDLKIFEENEKLLNQWKIEKW